VIVICVIYYVNMLTQNIVYYLISSTVIYLIAQLAGLDVIISSIIALMVPPILLLVYRIIR